jgi:hypothetical protein
MRGFGHRRLRVWTHAKPYAGIQMIRNRRALSRSEHSTPSPITGPASNFWTQLASGRSFKTELTIECFDCRVISQANPPHGGIGGKLQNFMQSSRRRTTLRTAVRHSLATASSRAVSLCGQRSANLKVFGHGEVAPRRTLILRVDCHPDRVTIYPSAMGIGHARRA